jgi:hypothetical protein
VIALAVAFLFLVTLLVAVLLESDRTPADADHLSVKDAAMTDGDHITGTPTEHDDLVSVRYHARLAEATS